MNCKVPGFPGNYVLGYWIDDRHTSRGCATAACRAIVEYTQGCRGAKVVWAGVKESNRASVAIPERLGFALIERLSAHLRFRISAAPTAVQLNYGVPRVRAVATWRVNALARSER
jgi:RimJ/RimL family protein N-acetyltransferase